MPLVALLLVKDALNLLLELYPDNPSLLTKFWLSMQGFLCFGMPSQLMIRWLVLEVVGLGSSWLPETSSKMGQKLSTISSGEIPICITTERNSCCRF